MSLEQPNQIILEQERASRIDELLKELGKNAVNPPRPDPHMMDFSSAALELYAEHEPFRTFIDQVIYHNPVSASETGRLLAGNVQYVVNPGINDPNYPPPDKSAWFNLIKNLIDNEPSRQALFEGMTKYKLQSNVSARYATLPLVANMVYDRWGKPIKAFDFGSSLNNGPKHAIGVMDFDPIAVETEDEALEPSINYLLKVLQRAEFEDITIDSILGFDRQKPTADSIPKARSDSLQFIDTTKPEVIERFDALLAAEPDNVAFEVADVLDPKSLQEYSSDFELGFISTMLYQHTEQECNQIIQNALNMLRDDGVLIIQEFAYVDPANPQALILRKEWTPKDEPYPYVTVMYDKANPQAGFQVLFEWTSGRCETVRPSDRAVELLKEPVRP